MAKCLPVPAREAIADAIPDSEIMIKWAERVSAFERELAVKKAEKAEEIAVKKAAKALRKLR